MGIADRKERQKEELRTRILNTAKDLFIARGYEDTSIRNIAEKIEYSPTTIYLYFKDKDDIFHALHQEGFTLLNQYFRPLNHVQDAFERLKAITRAYISFAADNPELYDLMFISKAPMNAIEKEEEGKWGEGERAFTFLVQTIEGCQQQGYFQGFNSEVLAFTLWSLVHGVCSLDIRCRDKVVSEKNRENLLETATETVVEMLNRMNQSK